jgi:hypothetical protein
MAIDSDDDPGLEVGVLNVDASNDLEAMDKAYDEVWDERLSITCNARFEVSAVSCN